MDEFEIRRERMVREQIEQRGIHSPALLTDAGCCHVSCSSV
jgi:hypothetical protein